MNWAKTTARRDEKHLSVGIWCALYKRFDCILYVHPIIIHWDVVPFLMYFGWRTVSYTRANITPCHKPTVGYGCHANLAILPLYITQQLWYCMTPWHREHPKNYAHASHFILLLHDDVIKWKHFPRFWPFVRGIHRSPVNSPHKGQWRGALMFSLICAWINGWVNDREAGDLRRHSAHYDVIVMVYYAWIVAIPFRITS